MLVEQKQVLERIAAGAPLAETLEALCRMVERHSGDSLLASVLLLDGDRLRHGAAPSLPEDYRRAIDGITIGPAVGSCGTAAYRRAPVFVSDIASDPLWADFAHLALAHGLRACWSLPIFHGETLLGTYAMYYKVPRSPSEQDLRLVDVVTRTAALAIERKQAEDRLRRQAAFLEGIIESSPAAIAIVAGDDLRFTLVNRAYQAIKGPESPLVGRTYADAFPEAAALGAADALREVIRTGRPWHIRDFRTPMGDRPETWWEGEVLALSEGAGPGRSALILTWEIGERKRAEQERERLLERLRETDRRKDEFLAMLAHELRNPLSSIKNATALLRLVGKAEEHRDWAQEVIDRQV
ncbi:MAG: GAF domain-containing protein, partial [Thermoleophilia bacterium]|nr:GAF domain-containing protein [Thermoleophilia bacterium]